VGFDFEHEVKSEINKIENINFGKYLIMVAIRIASMTDNISTALFLVSI